MLTRWSRIQYSYANVHVYLVNDWFKSNARVKSGSTTFKCKFLKIYTVNIQLGNGFFVHYHIGLMNMHVVRITEVGNAFPKLAKLWLHTKCIGVTSVTSVMAASIGEFFFNFEEKFLRIFEESPQLILI